jgi:hypothetical protein
MYTDYKTKKKKIEYERDLVEDELGDAAKERRVRGLDEVQDLTAERRERVRSDLVQHPASVRHFQPENKEDDVK